MNDDNQEDIRQKILNLSSQVNKTSDSVNPNQIVPITLKVNAKLGIAKLDNGKIVVGVYIPDLGAEIKILTNEDSVDATLRKARGKVSKVEVSRLIEGITSIEPQ